MLEAVRESAIPRDILDSEPRHSAAIALNRLARGLKGLPELLPLKIMDSFLEDRDHRGIRLRSHIA